MPVYDRSYRRWDGELSRRSLRFIPIASQGIRQALAFKGGWFLRLNFRALLFLSCVPFLLFFFINYLVNYQPDFMPAVVVSGLKQLLPIRAAQYPLLIRINIYFVMAFCVIVGSGLIARDRAAGAMPLYLSRPLTRIDYALGKFGVLAWFLGGLTIVPCIVLWLFVVISSPEDGTFMETLPELPRILLHGGVVVVTYASTMLAVSALFRRPMFAGLVWYALIVFLPTFTSFAGARLNWTAVSAISPNDSFEAIGFDLWNIDALRHESGLPREAQGMLQALKLYPETPVEWCWISVVCWTVASLAVLTIVLRRQDVVTDAAR
jgi:ABC-type transport system involved in multi-copper enzyme maturation permease subunit